MSQCKSTKEVQADNNSVYGSLLVLVYQEFIMDLYKNTWENLRNRWMEFNSLINI